MAGERTTLLRNIEADLKNTRRTPALSAFKFSNKTRHVAPAFIPLLQPTPYFLITPGPVDKRQDVGRTDEINVNIHVVHAILSHHTHYYTLLGSDQDDGILLLLDVIEEALWRPQPYVGTTFGVLPYTALPGVRCTSVVSATEIELAEPPLVADLFVKEVISFRYLCEKV